MWLERVRVVGIAFLLVAALSAFAFPQAAHVGETWMNIALIALFISYLIIGIAFMYAIGFHDTQLEAWCRHEFYQAMATGILLAILIGSNAVLNDFLYNMFWDQSFLNPGAEGRPEIGEICGDAEIEIYDIVLKFASLKEPDIDGGEGFESIQWHAVGYIDCIRRRNTLNLIELSIMGSMFGVIQGLWLSIDIQWIAGPMFISPGQIFKPLGDTFSYIILALAGMVIQIIAQEELLKFSVEFMFALILPVGIGLRSFAATRSAGGALIAIAVGFYIFWPITYLLQEEVVADYCGENNCEASIMVEIFETGAIHEILKAMFASGQRGGLISSALGGGDASLADYISLDGPMGPVLFMSFVAGAALPLFGLVMTLMFTKSLASLLGAEIDFSSLLKII